MDATETIQEPEPLNRRIWPEVTFLIILASVFLYVGLRGLTFPRLASYLPLFIGGTGALLCCAVLLRVLIGPPGSAEAPATSVHTSKADPDPRRTMLGWLWILGLVLAIYLIGVRLAAPFWVGGMLLSEGRLRARWAVAITLSLWIGLWVFGEAMGLRWPENRFGL